MRLLVTGADGFVGRWLVRSARAEGHDVIASVIPGAAPPAEWADPGDGPLVEVVRADVREKSDLQRLAATPVDAVVHLAAIASGAAARLDPQAAMDINAIATVWLLTFLAEAGQHPRFLLVSSGEVYGGGHGAPIPETAEVHPGSPYAASKWAAEEPARSIGESEQIPLIIARPFPHTGPGQTPQYVLPALASRLIEAKRTGATSVKTGNLAAVRDFLDVRDVVRAYLLLLEHGVAGEVYNVASGVGHRLADCFRMLADIVGVDATAAQDAALLRPGDIPVLIGDPARLHAATGWVPAYTFDRTLEDLVNAQAH